MSVITIRQLPDPVLRQKAKRVRKIDPYVDHLIDDMIDTMHAAGGVGLAANQVGVLLRVIVLHLPEEEEPRVYVNPEITSREGQREVEEGCLSIPGYRGLIMRAVQVKARGLDRGGRLIKVTAEGLLAQAIEHEVDHLNGILYIDHLESHEKLYKLEPEDTAVEGGVSSSG